MNTNIKTSNCILSIIKNFYLSIITHLKPGGGGRKFQLKEYQLTLMLVKCYRDQCPSINRVSKHITSILYFDHYVLMVRIILNCTKMLSYLNQHDYFLHHWNKNTSYSISVLSEHYLVIFLWTNQKSAFQRYIGDMASKSMFLEATKLKKILLWYKNFVGLCISHLELSF